MHTSQDKIKKLRQVQSVLEWLFLFRLCLLFAVIFISAVHCYLYGWNSEVLALSQMLNDPNFYLAFTLFTVLFFIIPGSIITWIKFEAFVERRIIELNNNY